MYRTTDFYLAAYLKAAGFPFKGLEFEPATRKATFIFDGVEQSNVLAYYNGTEPRVPIRVYVNAVRETRELLYNLPAR